jgi:hypothetical protein
MSVSRADHKTRTLWRTAMPALAGVPCLRAIRKREHIEEAGPGLSVPVFEFE